ncbi:hypothetical protein BCR33DRAFT_718531 [Rhizoclosmatium globosum]|uniref:Uncharacterized protein n=1 Tax=Rhizoclosmatium globosum TaxID=329046 RepID=A0A1Y2C494_9FUNG|nr:hypothetical protein BCR33DRAFT_718531 [Rhizoclosmatium globosum]|eukprot:ORY41860.1 hypothetical protein BCR33DRAFT_718531 [Rhizoclosmatium globosum]
MSSPLLPATGVWTVAFVGHPRPPRKQNLNRRWIAQLEAMIAADKPAAEIAKFKAVVRQLQFDIRCHANFTENVPFSVLVIGAAELNGVDVKVVHAFLAVLFVARVSVGVTLTGFVTLAAAIASAVKVFGH